jgi:hypothetical protein
MISARFRARRDALVAAASGTEKGSNGIGIRQPQTIPPQQWDDVVGTIGLPSRWPGTLNFVQTLN